MSYESMSGFGFGDETDGLIGGRPAPVQVTNDLPAGPSTGGARPGPIAQRPAGFQVSGGGGGPSTGGARPGPIAQRFSDGVPGVFLGVKPNPKPFVPTLLVTGSAAPQDPSGTCGPCESTQDVPWLWIALAAAAGIGAGYLVKQEMDKKKKGEMAA